MSEDAHSHTGIRHRRLSIGKKFLITGMIDWKTMKKGRKKFWKRMMIQMELDKIWANLMTLAWTWHLVCCHFIELPPSLSGLKFNRHINEYIGINRSGCFVCFFFVVSFLWWYIKWWWWTLISLWWVFHWWMNKVV